MSNHFSLCHYKVLLYSMAHFFTKIFSMALACKHFLVLFTITASLKGLLFILKLRRKDHMNMRQLKVKLSLLHRPKWRISYEKFQGNIAC